MTALSGGVKVKVADLGAILQRRRTVKQRIIDSLVRLMCLHSGLRLFPSLSLPHHEVLLSVSVCFVIISNHYSYFICYYFLLFPTEYDKYLTTLRHHITAN